MRLLLLFAAATPLLTWPVIATPGQAIAAREDYFSNLWNLWWMRTAVFELHASPWWTDHLYHPLGISLARHTLSPVNSLLGALLLPALSPQASFDALLLAHFALSGWAAAWLARELSASTGGAVLAGLVYSFCPLHYYYLAQINVATFEFLPLALLFLLRHHRDGGTRNAALAALCFALLAASSSYYAAYAFLLAGILGLAGRLLGGDTPWGRGMRRTAAAAAAAVVTAALVAWPLVASLLTGGAGEAETTLTRGGRWNDLLGYRWSGPPEELLASWPTMLGYTTLALLAVGFRGVAAQPFWILVAGTFFVLSLGPSLQVGGHDTGIPLPYRWLRELPVLHLLAKADRFAVVVQLAVALLAAFAWRDVAARIRSRGPRAAALVAVALALALELTGVPFARFDVACPPGLARLAADPGVRSLVSLPAGASPVHDARSVHFQTCHGAKIAGGYTTNLALARRHLVDRSHWRRVDAALEGGDAGPLVDRARRLGLDAVVLHASAPVPRAPGPLDGRTVFAPFARVRRELVGSRQAGGLVEALLPIPELRARRAALERALGPPSYEDDDLTVFPVAD